MPPREIFFLNTNLGKKIEGGERKREKDIHGGVAVSLAYGK